MVEENNRFRLVAVSISKAGDAIVTGSDGQPRLFVGSLSSLSPRGLSDEFVDGLIAGQNWQLVPGDRALTLEELVHHFGPDESGGILRLPRRLASVFGRRFA